MTMAMPIQAGETWSTVLDGRPPDGHIVGTGLPIKRSLALAYELA
jgi:hypothetical protein